MQGVIGAFRIRQARAGVGLVERAGQHQRDIYGKLEPANKEQLVQALLPKVYAWARAMLPEQPLTSGVWKGDWSSAEKLSPIEKIQMEQSDIISFHNYDQPEEFEKRSSGCRLTIGRSSARSIWRGEREHVPGVLPIAKKYKVAAINWGFVQGKTQTKLPWDSWKSPYVDREPAVWFHDIFHAGWDAL